MFFQIENSTAERPISSLSQLRGFKEFYGLATRDSMIETETIGSETVCYTDGVKVGIARNRSRKELKGESNE